MVVHQIGPKDHEFSSHWDHSVSHFCPTKNILSCQVAIDSILVSRKVIVSVALKYTGIFSVQMIFDNF